MRIIEKPELLVFLMLYFSWTVFLSTENYK